MRYNWASLPSSPQYLLSHNFRKRHPKFCASRQALNSASSERKPGISAKIRSEILLTAVIFARIDWVAYITTFAPASYKTVRVAVGYIVGTTTRGVTASLDR